MFIDCSNFDPQRLILAFASIIGTTVAAVLLQWLKTVVSNLQDLHQQKADNDAERIRKA
jgi:hypothetical protein